MRCSVCETELIQGDSEKSYETTADHVCNPNETPPLRMYWRCPNEECDTNKLGSFWGYNGEFFHGYENFRHKFDFIDGWSGALGSIARQTEVEVYKKDENYTFLNLWFFKFNWVWQYEADEDGNILKRKPKLEVWKRERGGGYVGYRSGIRMFFFCLGRFKRHLKEFKKTASDFHKSQLIREFKPEWEDKRLWKRLYHKWINFRYKKFRKKLLEV